MRIFIKKLLSGNFDIWLAMSGALFIGALAVILTAQDYSVLYIIACIMGVAGCLSYKAIRNRWVTQNTYSTRPYDILFMLCILSAGIVYLLRPEGYVRPLAFFVLLAVASGILAVKIIIKDRGEKDRYTLVEIACLGLLATMSISFLYPSLIGMDPWWHMRQTTRMVEQGIVDYNSLPVMYLIIAGLMKITGFSYRTATIISIAVPVTIANIYLTYLLGKSVRGRKIGLMACLAVAFAGWSVFFIVWTIPNILALTFVLAIILLSVKWIKGELRSRIYAVALLLLILALVFTHPVATMWACIFLALMAIVVLVAKRKLIKPGVIIIVASLVVITLLWGQLGYIGQLKNLIIYNFSPEYLDFTAPTIMASDPAIITIDNSGLVEAGILDPGPVKVPASTEMLSSAPLFESIWNVLGMFAYFAIAMAGVWTFVSRKSSAHGFLVIVFGVVALACGFLPMLLGMSFLEHRWWLAAEIILSIPVAWAIIKVGSGKKISMISAGVMVSILCFLNLTGLPANMDNRAISQNQLARYAFTTGELDALKYALCFPGTIGIDEFYTLATNDISLRDKKGERVLNISPELLSGDIINTDFVIIRTEVRDGLLATGSGTIYRLNYDPVPGLQRNGYRIVFENKDALVLTK